MPERNSAPKFRKSGAKQKSLRNSGWSVVVLTAQVPIAHYSDLLVFKGFTVRDAGFESMTAASGVLCAAEDPSVSNVGHDCS